MKNIKKLSGMTLIEVVVVLAILGILLVPMLDISYKEVQLMMDTKEKTEAKDVVNIMDHYIYKRVAFAQKITLSSTPVGSIGEKIKTQSIFLNSDGDLVHRVVNAITGQLEDHTIISKKGMTKYDVSFKVTKENSDEIKIIIKVTDPSDGKVISENIRYIVPNNMKRLGEEVVAVPETAEFDVINFEIPN